MASAKEINYYKVNDYAPKFKGMSTKEYAQEKTLQYANNLTNAKTFKFNSEQAELTRAFNKAEAETARKWQEQMSNTAHTREVKDLKAAGLNPVLSANTGAQSYTTTAASAHNASANADSAANAIAAYGGSYLNSMATKYASNQSAAAMRYSANMNYAAAQAAAYASMYAADRHYDATKYQSDKSYESYKYGVDNSKSGSMWGVLDTWLNKAQSGEGVPGYIGSQIKEIVGDMSINDLKKNDNAPLSMSNIDTNGLLKLAAVYQRLRPYLPQSFGAYSTYKKAKLVLEALGIIKKKDRYD